MTAKPAIGITGVKMVVTAVALLCAAAALAILATASPIDGATGSVRNDGAAPLAQSPLGR